MIECIQDIIEVAAVANIVEIKVITGGTSTVFALDVNSAHALANELLVAAVSAEAY